MAESVIVVERIVWVHAEAIEGADSSTNSEIIRVFRKWEDAKSFCESISEYEPYDFKWYPDEVGSRMYSGKITDEEEGVEVGMSYVFHIVAID